MFKPSERMTVEGEGSEVLLNIVDGRAGDEHAQTLVDEVDFINPFASSDQFNSRVNVRPCPGQKHLFTLDFTTSHYAFTCARSRTTRSLDHFYQLNAILKVALSITIKLILF